MKYVYGLMLASLSMLTYAQRTPLACQVDRAAGLNWEQGKWSVRGFIEKKFILVKEGSSLTIDSVATALQSYLPQTKCEVSSTGKIICFDVAGGSLFFSPKSNKGGISQLFGASSDAAINRDTVSVEVFTCTPF